MEKCFYRNICYLINFFFLLLIFTSHIYKNPFFKLTLTYIYLFTVKLSNSHYKIDNYYFETIIKNLHSHTPTSVYTYIFIYITFIQIFAEPDMTKALELNRVISIH